MRGAFAAIALLLASFSAHASDATTRAAINDQRGFVPEKVYQFDGIDSVNLFNGNLTLTLPLGGTYPVSSHLSYGLQLHYNSKVWELKEGGQNGCFVGQPNSFAAFPSTVLHHRGSAGLGWTFSLGQVVPYTENPLEPFGAYYSPDGASHPFGNRDTLDPNTSGGYVSVTTSVDGSNLRLKKKNTNDYEIEFPDGSIHEFNGAGLLYKMRDRFGNAVSVTQTFTSERDENGILRSKWKWTLTDSFRSQVITFRDFHEDFTDVTRRFEMLRWIVESIDLAVFSGGGTSQPTGRYKFVYTYDEIARGCTPGFNYAPCNDRVVVPLLQKLVWVPDGTTFTFDYNKTAGLACQQGMLSRITLPTGGGIGWTYGDYALPANGCADLNTGPTWMNHTTGVIAKTLYDSNGSVIGNGWKYEPKSGRVETTDGYCGETQPIGGGQPIQITHTGVHDVSNTVTDPLGRVTVHYFATWNEADIQKSANRERDYGLPYTRRTVAPGAAGRFLSREFCDGPATACSPSRTVYAAYDDAISWPQMLAERTVFNKDASHYVDSASSDYAGYGRYRTTVVSSSFGPTRTSYVDHDGTGIGPNDPWIMNRYTTESVTEPVGGVDSTSVSKVCLDATTGLLRAKRQLQGTEEHPADVIVRYTYDSAGNQTAEDWYGGDKTSLTQNDLCSSSTAAEASQYRINHGYTAGLRTSSTYRNATFKSFDITVDARSGLASAVRDPAEASITYKYDELGRVIEVRPLNEAWKHYTYLPFASQAEPAAVIERTYAANADLSADPPPEVLTERRIYDDGLGRVRQIRQRMPSGWAVVQNGYDGAGQRTSVSMPETGSSGDFNSSFSPPSTTVFTFDRFGRVATVTTPDGKVATTVYNGIRLINRTVDVDGTSVKTREEYDAHGRLLSVTENADKPGAVKTEYKYDLAGRLTDVSTTASGVTQTRKFLYDNRGFLLVERHPEKGSAGDGLVYYGTFEPDGFKSAYDARGHVLRRVDGTFGGSHDLAYTYDEMERLTKIEDLDSSGHRRTLKQFTYGTLNSPGGCIPSPSCNALKGKLHTAVRSNYVPDLGTVNVTETYAYKSLGGRPTTRTTTVGSTTTFSGANFTMMQSWDELGNLTSLTYPSTSAVSAPRTVAYAYDEGLLTEVGGYGTISYHPTGQVAAVAHDNGLLETIDRDGSNMPRPKRITVTRPADGATLWQSGDYEYDGAGNITKIGNTSYDYDAMNRLTSWTVSSPGWSYKTVRTLDAFGNATRTSSLGCPDSSSGLRDCFETAFARNVDSATNHYSFQTYDDAGSVTSDGRHSFAYDAVAMPVSITSDLRSDRFLYTADDERIAVVSLIDANGVTRNRTTWTLRATNNLLLRTFTDDSTSGTRVWSWTEDEIWRGAEIIASESPAGRKHYSLDHLGSPRFVADANGNRIGEQTFTPFGGGGTSDGGRIQFTGHEADSESLTYMHARYHDGAVGRFLSVDPVLDVEKALREPQLWNRYAYVTNNPLKYVDLNGRERLLRRSALPNQTNATANVASARQFLADLIHYDEVREAFSGFSTAPTNEKIMAGMIATIALADIASNAIAPEKGAVRKTGAIMLGHFPEYLEAGLRAGARVFNVPPAIWNKMDDVARWAANQKFLDRAIQRGATLLLATDPRKIKAGSFLEREVKYLKSLGYELVKDGDYWKFTK
jgi:RHS repeat-associated protein